MLKPSLQLKLGQSLTMTPQLQQAIRLLQLPVLDLSAQIQDALEENIMLEMEDLPDVPKTDTEPTVEVEAVKPEDTWQSNPMERIQETSWNGEGKPINEYADQSGQSLREHLLWQLELESFTPRESVIGEALIDSINDDGYLTTELGDVIDSIGDDSAVSVEEVEATLRKVQRLDPVCSSSSWIRRQRGWSSPSSLRRITSTSSRTRSTASCGARCVQRSRTCMMPWP
jgi:RNA polymerase sigma-54 factor